MCRACTKSPETLGHVLSSCGYHAWGLYKARHDRVLYQLTKAIAESLGLEVPKALRAPGGEIKGGVIGPPGRRIVIDQTIPTDRQTPDRRPDLVVKVRSKKRAAIFEVACAWDPLVATRERQKRTKYLELAADLAHQWPGYRIEVIPVVVGDLGIIGNLKNHLTRSGLLDDTAIKRVMKEMQTEVLCGAVRIIKRHMTT